MSQVTQLLNAVGDGETGAQERLLKLVYDELRRLAAQKLARESPGHTLDATALVHEAYLRLLSPARTLDFENRGHFFAAAAEAMRRILVESARRRHARKRGGNRPRAPLDEEMPAIAPARPIDDLLALDEALRALATEDEAKARLVTLRYFTGMTLAQAAEALQISHNTADRWWAYAKAFLFDKIHGGETKI